MKLRKLTRQLAAAAVAGAMALSLCAPALAAAPAADTVHLPQRALSNLVELGTVVSTDEGITYSMIAVPDGFGGYMADFVREDIGEDSSTLERDCDLSYDDATKTLTLDCRIPEERHYNELRFDIGNGINLHIKASQGGNYRLGRDVTITGGAANVTIEEGNNVLVGWDLNVRCTGALKITGSAECLAYGALNVYNSDSVEVNGSCSHYYLFESARITSKGAVTLKNTGGHSPDAVYGALNVDAGGAVTVESSGDCVKDDATITSGGAVKLDAGGNGAIGAVGGKLTVRESTSVEVCSGDYGLPVIGGGAGIKSSGPVEVYREHDGEGAVIKGDTRISSGGSVQLRNGTTAVEGALTILQSSSVYLNGKAATGGAVINSSGPVEVECQTTQENQKQDLTCILDSGIGLDGYKVVKGEDSWNTKDVTDLNAQQDSPVPIYTYTGNAHYLKITPVTMHTLTVNGGTASVRNVQGRTSIRLYEGLDVAVQAAVPAQGRSFKGWTGEQVVSSATDPLAGTFRMPDQDVTLTAAYNDLYTVKVNGTLLTTADGSTAYYEAGARVAVKADPPSETAVFAGWTAEGSGVVFEDAALPATTVTLPDPGRNVELHAAWTEPADPSAAAPADGGAGGAIAAVALGGAALWGGYEVATRVILHKLLPEGAAIPKTQAQLALLLWNTAGQPEPANAPAFADVDAATAKAAQWCTEQGYLSGTFRPEKRVTKFTVIRAWNKAFPKAA